MKKLILSLMLLLSLILLNSCSQSKYFVRGEYGYGTPFAVADAIVNMHDGIDKRDGLKRSSLPMDGHYGSIKVGVRGLVFGDLGLSIAVGPALFSPEKGVSSNEEFLSFDVTPRLYYAEWFIYPYIEALAGVGWTDRRKWEGQATQWNFSIGGGIGVEVPINKHWSIDFGYRNYHISNGSQIFGSPSPNHGYNTDLIIGGLQYNF